MELDPCKHCSFVGDSQSKTSAHVHTQHPGKDCTNHFCWTCGLMFKKESTLKRHNTSVKHQLEEKRMKIVTENLQYSTTLWTTTAPEVRYLSNIDHIDQESCKEPQMPCKQRYSPIFKILSKMHPGGRISINTYIYLYLNVQIIVRYKI